MRRRPLVSCFIVLACACTLAQSCKKKVDATKFEAAHRSLRSITEATRTGVNVIRLDPLVAQLEGDVAVLGDRVKTDKEREIHRMFQKAASHYRDSVVLWKYAIRQEWNEGDYIRLLAIDEDYPQIMELAKRNFLAIVKGGDSELDTLRPQALQDIWSRGEAAAERAVTELKIWST